jgi:beta-galactosidase
VAWFQQRLPAAKPASPITGSPRASDYLEIDLTSSEITITGLGANFTITFDKARGYLTRWAVNDTDLLDPDTATGVAVTPSFWRPPTDNDNPGSFPYWHRFGVDALTSQLRSFSMVAPSDESNHTAQVIFTTFLTPPVLDWGYLATTTYTITPSGTLSIAVRLKPSGSYPPKHVPRVGLDLRLPRRLDEVKWFGLGPGESYPDKRAAQRLGVWSAGSVAELHTPYEVPQEGGNRMGTRWVSLREPGGAGAGVRVTASAEGEWSANCEREFSFKVGRYSDKAVQAARHPCDLVEEDATLLRLDGRVAGVGTGACGPAVREDLMVPVEEMEFGFCLEPVGV